MAYKKTYKRYVRRKPAVPKRTQKIRQLSGQKALTWPETIARGIGPVARLAGSVAQLAGLINSEAKELDTVVSGTGISNSGSYSQALTNIAEGDDRNQRNGRFILAKHLQYRMQVLMDNTVQTRFSYAIVMDKKANEGFGATPWQEVFTSADPTALINRDAADRFIILKRGVLHGNAGGNSIVDVKGFLNLKGVHLKYNNTTSTSYEKNAIFLLAVSNQPTNVASLYANIRFEYYDN